MAKDMETIVHIDGVTKRFGAVTAVDHMDMKIHAGEFVTFLGPSGCGKSTTLRLLGGFERPDEGRILLDGKDVTALPPNRRKVNMVFQDYALFPHMSVRRNIAFGLELKGLGRGAIDARLGELMAFLELEALGDRRPDQLSGGQRQRVALARALAPDPALLLLDEPLGALDAKLRGQVQEELKSIQRRTGKTFFFVTHDQDEALTMSDRIVVMNQGHVEQDGTPEDLYFRPASRFVAEFIGETNLITAEAKGPEGGLLMLDWFGHQVAGQPVGTGVSVKGPVSASLRPEKLRLATKRPESGNAVPGRVVNRIFKGSRTLIEAQLEGSEARLKAYLDNERAVELDEGQVWLSWDASHLAVLRD
ncbi:MAG: ABC transporter ATP-binding protein [Pseudorhodobacter sp.]